MKEQVKVWIYQSDRALTADETTNIQAQVNDFTQSWASHQKALKATGEVLHNRFLVLKVDENQSGASGCSIDSSVKFIQDLGMTHNINFFDRLNFAYQQDGKVQVAQKDDFAQLYQSGQINDDTVVFNNLVKNEAEMETGWQVRLADSWHKRFV